MPQAPLISVIVPVYKVERFLDRCVESLIRQTYDNLEIILVDDGSPDCCPEMCDAWAEKDGRVKVIHKENGGLSDARNRGVSAASGEYISFVDSDDYVSPDYAKRLLSLLRETGADISCVSIRSVYDGNEDFSQQPEELIRVFDRQQTYAALRLEFYMPLVAACGKLIPAELVRANPFPVGRLHEDEAVTYKYFYNAEKVALTSLELYAYYQNGGSITHNKTAGNMKAALLAYEEQCLYFREKGDEALSASAAERLLNTLVDFADRGDEVCREFLAAKRERQYFVPHIGVKTHLRYWGYRLFKTDLNKQYHKLLGR